MPLPGIEEDQLLEVAVIRGGKARMKHEIDHVTPPSGVPVETKVSPTRDFQRDHDKRSLYVREIRTSDRGMSNQPAIGVRARTVTAAASRDAPGRPRAGHCGRGRRIADLGLRIADLLSIADLGLRIEWWIELWIELRIL